MFPRGLACTGFLLALVVAAPAVEVRRDLEYGRAGGESLLLDAGIPDGPGPFPVAILVHGGLPLVALPKYLFSGIDVFALMAVLSARVVYDHIHYGETTPGIGVPQWWYSIWLPVMSVAISGRALGLFIRRGRRA